MKPESHTQAIILLLLFSVVTLIQGQLLPENYNSYTYGSLDGSNDGTDFGGSPSLEEVKRGFPPFSMSNFRLRIKPSMSQKFEGPRRLSKRFSYAPLSPATWPIKIMGEDGTVYAIFLPDKLIPSIRRGPNGKPVFGVGANGAGPQTTNGKRLLKPEENTAAVVEDAAAVTNFPDLKYVHLRFG